MRRGGFSWTRSKTRKNVLIAGATGAGKTTLLNACLGEMERIAPETRLLVIEDTPEIRSPFRNSVALRTSDGVTMDRLLVSALRQAPDRIVVGEVREGSVLLTLVKAWNTGHPGGLVTLHANSADEVIDRLSLLATEVMAADPVPVLMQATDLIVFIHRDTGRPVLSSIRAAVRDPDGAIRLEDLAMTMQAERRALPTGRAPAAFGRGCRGSHLDPVSSEERTRCRRLDRLHDGPFRLRGGHPRAPGRRRVAGVRRRLFGLLEALPPGRRRRCRRGLCGPGRGCPVRRRRGLHRAAGHAPSGVALAGRASEAGS